MSRVSGAALRAASLTGLLGGAGLALVAGAQPWWRAVDASVSVAFTGARASAGLGQALALVVLVGTLLALVLAARGRRVLGAVLTLAGAGSLALGVSRPRPSADAVRSEVRQVSLADQFALSPTAWPWVYALAGLVVLGAALLMLSTASAWPQGTRRFQRSTKVSAPVVDPDDPASLWRSLDAGLDPTLDVVSGPDLPGPGLPGPAPSTTAGTDPSAGVDVHESSSGDTMGQAGAGTPPVTGTQAAGAHDGSRPDPAVSPTSGPRSSE